MSQDSQTTPYRNTQTTLASRLEDLHQELAEIRQARSNLEALARRETEVVSEISELASELAKTRGKRSLSLLDMAYVASPCKADWNEMVGDERTRFCGLCQKNVHNLSAMSGDEAEALLRQLNGDGCIRLYRRKDGTVMTNDCPVGVRNTRIKRAAAVVVGAGMTAAGVVMPQAESDPEIALMLETDTKEMTHTEGAVAPLEPRLYEEATGGMMATPNPPPFPAATDTPPRLLSGPSAAIGSEWAGGLMVAKCTITTEGRTRDCKTVVGPSTTNPRIRQTLDSQRYAPATRRGIPIEVSHVIRVRLEKPATADGARQPMVRNPRF